MQDVIVTAVPTGTKKTQAMSDGINELLRELRPADPPKARNLQDVLFNADNRLIVALRGYRSGMISSWEDVPARAYVGMLTLAFDITLTQSRAHIEHVVVDPRFRRQGIARALLETALYIGRERGVGRFELTTSQGNRVANELYERMGFVWRSTNNWRYTPS